MLKVIIDTNVLVSALLKSDSIPALIVSSVLQKHITLCLSDDIFTEYKEVLAYKKFKKLDQDEINNLLSQFRQYALWFYPQVSLNVIRDDISDNIFLECAHESEADFLITGNKKHFGFDSYHCTKIINPGEFMDILMNIL